MIDVLKLVACSLAVLFKSRARLEAEILVLRHQLIVLRRKAPPRPRLGVVDRLIVVWRYGLCPSVISAVTIVQPETVVCWHRNGFHDYPLLTIAEIPQIEIHIVTSREAPSGAGECGVPPVAPAIANAIFAATGKRLRRLPISKI